MGGNIKILLQKCEVLQGGSQMLKGRGWRGHAIQYTIPAKDCHLHFTLWTTWQVGLWPHFSKVTN